MEKNPRLSKISFSITPSQEGYIIACNEIPYLFTDAKNIEEVNSTISRLVTEYIEYFPHDATKRGISREIETHAVWKARPNSVALE
jgi:predicted RNase H-like HicB family nuclease